MVSGTRPWHAWRNGALVDKDRPMDELANEWGVTHGTDLHKYFTNQTYVISPSSINVLIPHTFFFNERDILTVFIGIGGFDHPPQAQ